MIVVSKRNKEPDYEVYLETVNNRVQCIMKLLNEYYSDVNIRTTEEPFSCFAFIFTDGHKPSYSVGLSVPFDYIVDTSIIDICNDLIRRYRQFLKEDMQPTRTHH